MQNLAFWVLGNAVLPLMPIGLILMIRWVVASGWTVDAVLGDGVLFFYGTTVTAMLLIDVLKDALRLKPLITSGEAVLAVSFALPICLTTMSCYAFLALLRTGAVSGTRAQALIHFSWQSAAMILVCVVAFRLYSGMY